MHEINKSLDDAARSIDRAAKNTTSAAYIAHTGGSSKPIFGYEQIARERAERELYAERYRERVKAESEREGTQPSPLHTSDTPREQVNPDTATRVTKNAPEAPVYTKSPEARVLTIPGAVYRIPTERAVREEPVPRSHTPTEPQVPIFNAPIPAEPSPIYTAAVADEAADDLFSYDPLPVYEPQSKTSHPTVADAAEGDVDVVGVDYGGALRSDDAGSYTAPTEYSEHEPVSREKHPIAIPYDPSHEEEEYTRFLAEQEQKRVAKRTKRKAALDQEIDPCYFPIDAIDKCVQLVKARMSYEIESLKAKHRMLGYTFSMDVLKKDRIEHKINRGINERMYRLSRAVKRERADSTRYYTAANDRYLGNADKRNANTAKIESVLGRLEYALKERERIDESLMRIYTQGISGSENVKETRVAERAARAAYRSQLKTAKRVARMHAPIELKEKIFTLMNERVAMLSTIERNEYLLSKKRYTGAEKRDIKRQNKALKRNARQKAEDVRTFVGKAQRHSERHGSGIHQIGWLVGTVLALAALGTLFVLAKYYWRLF